MLGPMKLRDRLTYANVMATIAVFLALGGGAYAAVKLKKGSVKTKHIKNGAVTQAKISASAQAALRGATGPPGAPGAPGNPANANTRLVNGTPELNLETGTLVLQPIVIPNLPPSLLTIAVEVEDVT